MPDIDVDFDDKHRQDVIDHVREVYGEDHVSGVITFGKLQAKNAVRDAARVMDEPYSVGDRICKMIGNDLGVTIDQAIEKNPDLKQAYDTEEDTAAVIDAARSIEGNVRNEGVHACATIICRDPMSEHVPMKRDTKGGGIITQYDGHYTPDLGLLKMDFLGLRTLGVITGACENIKERFGISHMLRAGIEVKPVSTLAIRAGYGLTTGAEKIDAWGDALIPDKTQNFSIGLGYSSKGSFFADFALRNTLLPKQYIMPYEDYIFDSEGYILEPVPELATTRSLWKALLTFGFRC
jgi:hypothetical protein